VYIQDFSPSYTLTDTTLEPTDHRGRVGDRTLRRLVLGEACDDGLRLIQAIDGLDQGIVSHQQDVDGVPVPGTGYRAGSASPGGYLRARAVTIGRPSSR